MLTDREQEALELRLRQRRKTGYQADQIRLRPADLADLPLSVGQEQLWFLDRFAPGVPAYNIPFAFGVTGPLDTDALGRALDQVAARHEPLRTRLVAAEEQDPVQVIDPPGPVPLPAADWSGLDPAEQDARLPGFIAAAAGVVFDLAAGPLLRAHLIRRSPADHVLLLVVHHAIFDGWSAGVFLRDLAALYHAQITGTPPALPDLAIQFADYAVWERGRLAGPTTTALENYWRQTLRQYPTVPFPATRPRPRTDDFHGALVTRATSPALLPALRDLSRDRGTTVYVTLLAGLLAVLHRYTGADDLVVGTVSARRGRRELDPLIGFLVNTLPIRADLTANPTFTELIDRVKNTTLAAYAHQDLPFARLVETLDVQRDPSRSPVFQILFTYTDQADGPAAGTNGGGGAQFTTIPLVPSFHPAKFDLDIHADASPAGLRIDCCYKTVLFDPAPMTALLEHTETLLTAAAARPGDPISDLPLLTPAELHRETAGWNDTAAPRPPGRIHHAFQAQAARTPHATAAQIGDQAWTYAQLNTRANQIARHLRQAGLAPETLAGVCLPTSLDRLAVLLAIFKAGGGYVPLDPALPPARLAYLITDTAMPLIITDTPTSTSLPPDTPATLIRLDQDHHHITAHHHTDPDWPSPAPASPAYVLYTSGSTGHPKGVIIEHRNAANFLHGAITRWHLTPADTTLQFASLGFDVSVLDTFAPLLSGGRLILAPPAILHSPPHLAALIRDHHITFASLPPAVAGLLAREPFPDLRLLITAGEELPAETARAWTRPGLTLINGYGPTETAVIATAMTVTTPDTIPPIGTPQPNCTAYILDPHLNPVPPGATGELHIGGTGVARGYLNRPALTATRFIPDPFTPGNRLYKTGDLARRNPDGTITYAGRTDTQIKINGQRIEPGEIETTLTTIPGIAQAFVTPTTTPAGDTQLTAYLRPDPGTTPPPPHTLRAHLSTTLPAAMIPAHYITLDTFPLNPSGKIDKTALPPPGPPPDTRTHHPPRTLLETLLTRYYATTLHLDHVSATHNFFDIGGNSLAAMRLITTLRTRLDADLNVTAIFHHPTPRQLAEQIELISSNPVAPASSGPMIDLSHGSGEVPLFLIHAIGGTVFAYLSLASELAGTFRVYGLEAPGLTDPAYPADRLDDLVSDYTERIRAKQATGPYYLAGWSMGGVLAFEIASRLERAGHQVSLLALIDAPFALPATDRPGRRQLAGNFVADAARGLGWDTADLPDPDRTTMTEQLTWLAERLGEKLGPDDPGTDEPGTDPSDMDGAISDGASSDQASSDGQLWRRFEIFRAHAQMLAGYQPARGDRPPVQAPALVISADHSPNAPARHLWPSLLSDPQVIRYSDADHYTLLQPPHARQVAASLLKIQPDAATPSGARPSDS